MTRALLFLLLFAACGRAPITGSTDALPTLTPSGALALYPGTYGAVLPWHVATAEASWQHVAPCVGVSAGAVSAFPVYLLSGPVAPGEYGHDNAGFLMLGAHPRIEILAASWDFDPRHPEETPVATKEIERVWRHELVHLALWKRDGDLDGAHVKAEWRCQE